MLQRLVKDYEYVHIGLGIAGNLAFVVGSVLFFKTFESWYTVGVWLFVFGSLGMLIGAVGRAVADFYEKREQAESA